MAMRLYFALVLFVAFSVGCPAVFNPMEERLAPPPCREDAQCTAEVIGAEWGERVCVLRASGEGSCQPADQAIVDAGKVTDSGPISPRDDGGKPADAASGPTDTGARLPDVGPLPPMDSGSVQPPLDGGAAGASCDDGMMNGDETDIDCGGSCPSACGLGQQCQEPADCDTGTCSENRCAEAAPGCGDGQLCGLGECPAWGEAGYEECEDDNEVPDDQCDTLGGIENACHYTCRGTGDPAIPVDPCPGGGGTYHCYMGRHVWFCSQQVSWEAARTACQNGGMTLISPETAAENGFVHTVALSLENAGNRNHLWMSLNRRDGNGWQWLSNNAVDYTTWAGGGPGDGEADRQCAYLIGDNDDPCCPDGTWFREDCGASYAFACELEGMNP